MHLTTILLSRIQFGFTVSFHILFPTLNLGLALFICIIEAIWLRTHNEKYLIAAKYWTKIFALTFGMGVVTGVVLAYELGTNFGIFTYKVGGVLGPLLAYEVLTAFFLEAGFLGVMLFGWNKVGPRLHFLATLLVTVGTSLSAFWIMSANSWMQAPSGFQYTDQYIVTSWLEAIFNPTFIPRLFHMLFASYLTACFFIAGISAWDLLRNKFTDLAKKSISIALLGAVILAPIQLMIGDVVGLNVFKYQPMKTAAMEGLWETTKGAPLHLFAIPSVKNEKNYAELSIPYGASLFNTHELKGEMPGLKSVKPEDRPMVKTVFFSFRIMLAIGFWFIGLAIVGLWLRFKNKLYDSRRFLKLCVYSTPLGFVATLAGWFVAEAGRQPWIVYGLMRTSEGASRVPMSQVLTSTILFFLVYGFVFVFYLFFLFKVIRQGPAVLDKEGHEEHMFQYMTGDQS